MGGSLRRQGRVGVREQLPARRNPGRRRLKDRRPDARRGIRRQGGCGRSVRLAAKPELAADPQNLFMFVMKPLAEIRGLADKPVKLSGENVRDGGFNALLRAPGVFLRIGERGHTRSQHLARGFELVRGVDLSEPRLATRDGGLDDIATFDSLAQSRLTPITRSLGACPSSRGIFGTNVIPFEA
jgi:hypothetical protein